MFWLCFNRQSLLSTHLGASLVKYLRSFPRWQFSHLTSMSITASDFAAASVYLYMRLYGIIVFDEVVMHCFLVVSCTSVDFICPSPLLVLHFFSRYVSSVWCFVCFLLGLFFLLWLFTSRDMSELINMCQRHCRDLLICRFNEEANRLHENSQAEWRYPVSRSRCTIPVRRNIQQQ